MTSWEVGPDTPRWVTFLRLDRLLIWLMNKTEEPQGEGRCPWLSGGSARCVKKRGHRGYCITRYENPTTYRSWYGVNFPDRKAS